MTVQSIHQVSEAVGQYYDHMHAFFTTLWGGSIHVGLWPTVTGTGNHDVAQDRLTDMAIRLLNPAAGHTVLDVGCGTGRPALRLAEQTGASVVGVTVSHKQIEHARRLTQQEGLANRVRFEYADALHLPFASETFDAAWALESLLHMPDREQVLHEILRILKPGGTFVLTDVTEEVLLDQSSRQLLYSGFMIESLLTGKEYPGITKKAGFITDQMLDISSSTKETLSCVSTALIEKRHIMVETYGEDFVVAMEQAWPQLAVIQRDYLGYIVLTVHKPTRMEAGS